MKVFVLVFVLFLFPYCISAQEKPSVDETVDWLNKATQISNYYIKFVVVNNERIIIELHVRTGSLDQINTISSFEFRQIFRYVTITKNGEWNNIELKCRSSNCMEIINRKGDDSTIYLANPDYNPSIIVYSTKDEKAANDFQRRLQYLFDVLAMLQNPYTGKPYTTSGSARPPFNFPRSSNP